MNIEHKFRDVDGVFNTDTCEMVCVPHWKYREVELCIKTDNGWNVPVAQIKLYDTDKWVDAEDTYDNARNLGEEIAKRWNAFAELNHKGQKAIYIPDNKIVWVEKNIEFDAHSWVDVDTLEKYYKEEIKLI